MLSPQYFCDSFSLTMKGSFDLARANADMHGRAPFDFMAYCRAN
jgi:hypothetical protein